MVGGEVRLTGDAIGVAPPLITFQWLKDESLISGAPEGEFEIGLARESDTGSYSVRVTAGKGLSITSEIALVEIAGNIQQDLVVHLTLDESVIDSGALRFS
ncbi:MAG: hypothetical protein M2R45_00586 [Verrucomicrobia subdivision 3 bacterium]|nr:hypothetical protein [Limisphaerales bacterium]MCS1413536.1 hypothetical protein [Limisphaerales bacterium]